MEIESNRYRSRYGPRLRVAESFEGVGRTKQGFAAECDINRIMARYMETGQLDPRMVREGRFGEIPDTDYQEAMFIVSEARSAFAELPASMRERFNNDPGQLLAWVHDPANIEEAHSLGLLDKSRLGEYLTPQPPASRGAPEGRQAPVGPAQTTPPEADNSRQAATTPG